MTDEQSLLFMKGQIKSLQKQIKQISAISANRKEQLQQCKYALKLLKKRTLKLESELNQKYQENDNGNSRNKENSETI